MDIFSHDVVDWLLTEHECADLAEQLAPTVSRATVCSTAFRAACGHA